ncbi:glycosyltransferase family 39 protein [Mucilaginibacter hurinus]|nr:glycosyltransferase family 39 protein [Mucilaginibacter hurinus]
MKSPQLTLARKRQELNYNLIIWIVIAIGVAIRLFHLLNNRSLWEDEVYLSTGLVNYDFQQLFTKGLPFQQKAPAGYLLVVKSLLAVLGNHEIPLRLFSFISGILSLTMFVPVVRHFFKPAGQVAAITVIAFSPVILYHSVEAKQYAVELFSTVLLLYLYVKYLNKTDVFSLIAWGIWGAIIIWFSFASVFVMAGIALAVGVHYLISKQYDVVARLIITFGLWFGSFIVNYVLFTQKGSDTGWLVDFFVKHDAFMPLSGSAITWLAQRIVSFLNYPMGLSWVTVYNAGVIEQAVMRMVFIPLALAAAGIFYLFRNNGQLLLIISAVFIFVLMGSAVKMYPFHERLTLFLAPLFTLLLAAGCDFFASTILKKTVFTMLMILLLVFGPLKNTVHQIESLYLFGDYKKSFRREALNYIDKNYRPGDLVYVYWNEVPGYELYKTIKALNFKAIEGKDYRHKANNYDEYFTLLKKDFAQFKEKKRVWVLQSRFIIIPIGDYTSDPPWYYADGDSNQKFYDQLMKWGKPIKKFSPADKRAIGDMNAVLMDFSTK